MMGIDLANKKTKRGWFGLFGFSIKGFLGNLMQDLALSACGRVLYLLNLVAAPDLFARKSKEQDLLD